MAVRVRAPEVVRWHGSGPRDRRRVREAGLLVQGQPWTFSTTLSGPSEDVGEGQRDCHQTCASKLDEGPRDSAPNSGHVTARLNHDPGMLRTRFWRQRARLLFAKLIHACISHP